ncbi:type IV secretion system DNA-binding domain-containing protein [Paeniroseomonas aquatica]|uniref:type IV secretion system DNA-binding domain-containing protein n=1 Tax=Paeniroseomonas aquatica TaxID=373043 RepID=UPI00360DC551
MSTVPRVQHGPSAASERQAQQIYRPIRSPFQTAREILEGRGSAVVLALMGGFAVAEPATVTAIAPLSLLYAGTVLSRPVVLPFRLPKSAGIKDRNFPAPGGRKPQTAAGIFYLGYDAETGEECWVTNPDLRQHISVPGITGAGKTETLLGFCFNCMSVGSGLVYVDGKADTDLYARIYALARLLNQERNIRALNFIVASGDRDSSTFNPFGAASPDAMREMLMAQIESNPEKGGGENHIFMQRAGALGALTPIFDWVRTNFRIVPDIELMRFSILLENIASIAVDRMFPRLNVDTNEVEMVDISAMPERLIAPLVSFLKSTGGYDMTLPWNKQRSEEPTRQHGFVAMHFDACFTQLAGSLGHIFRAGIPDIDMRDIVLNRRILLVNLPALENSGETTTSLGKLTIAVLRSMMAQSLGGQLEGDYEEIIANKPATADTPFGVVLDELAAFVSTSTTTLLQQGRGQGYSFVLGWHDVAGLRARIGDAAYTLLNNAPLQLLMRQHEGGENRRHIESTVGESDTTQITSYRSKDGGAYQEAETAEVRRTSRVDWRDLRGLIAGEGVMVLGNTKVHANLFYANTSAKGAIRRARPVPLTMHDPAAIRQAVDSGQRVRKAIEGADRPERVTPPLSPVLQALFQGFGTARAAGIGVSEAIDAGINAAGAVPMEDSLYEAEPTPATPPDGLGEAPVTEFSATLASVVDRPQHAASEQSTIVSVDRQVADLLQQIAEIEERTGLDPADARTASIQACTERDAALDGLALQEPRALPPEELRRLLGSLVAEVRRAA